MEYMEYSLKDIMKGKGIMGFVEICCKLVDCVEEFHSSGFVHLDIKPDNFMVNETGQIKLIDFGIA